MPTERTWAGTHTYCAGELHRPASVEQLREMVAAAPQIRVLGRAGLALHNLASLPHISIRRRGGDRNARLR